MENCRSPRNWKILAFLARLEKPKASNCGMVVVGVERSAARTSETPSYPRYHTHTQEPRMITAPSPASASPFGSFVSGRLTVVLYLPIRRSGVVSSAVQRQLVGCYNQHQASSAKRCRARYHGIKFRPRSPMGSAPRVDQPCTKKSAIVPAPIIFLFRH